VWKGEPQHFPCGCVLISCRFAYFPSYLELQRQKLTVQEILTEMLNYSSREAMISLHSLVPQAFKVSVVEEIFFICLFVFNPQPMKDWFVSKIQNKALGCHWQCKITLKGFKHSISVSNRQFEYYCSSGLNVNLTVYRLVLISI
jgi:hypothetical protein